MKAKIIILAIFSVFILNVNNVHATVISDSGTYQIGTLGNYGTNDFFTQLIDNHRDLTGGNGTFLLTNPTPVDIPINQTLLNHYFGYNNTPITSTSILILSNVTHSDNITDYTNVCQQYNLTNKTDVQSPRNNTILKNGGFLNPTNAYDKNHNTWAVANRSATAALSNSTLFRNFTLDIPANAVIDGIQIISELNISATTGTFYYEVNNGTRYSKMNYSQAGSTTRTNYTKGSPTDLWGLIWNSTTANNISVNITAFGSSTNRIQKLEEIWVNITYHTIETNQSNCSDVPIGWHWNNYTTQDFIPVPNTTLKSGDTAIISVIANWPAKLGDIAIDWIPLLIIPKSITGADNDTILTKENWAWWNTSYLKKKQIVITNQTTIGSNEYPIEFWFPHGGNVLSDCRDIRIVNETLNAVIPYGQRSCNSTHVLIATQVNITRNVTDIYVYYNSSTAGWANSSWFDVRYNLWDNFTTLDTTKWNEDEPAPTKCINYVQGGMMMQQCSFTDAAAYNTYFSSLKRFNNFVLDFDYIVRNKDNNTYASYDESGVHYRVVNYSRETAAGSQFNFWGNASLAEILPSGGSFYPTNRTAYTYHADRNIQNPPRLATTLFNFVTGTSYNISIAVFNHTHNISIGGVLRLSTADWMNGTSDVGNITFKVRAGDGGNGVSLFNITYDNVRVRNWVSPEPTITIGAEESVPDTTPPTYSTITINNTNPAILDQVNFSFNASDNIQLDKAIFGWNASGAGCNAWANDTGVSFMAGNWSNVTKQIPATCLLANVGGISFQFYFNDTSNNWNTTPVYNISGFNTGVTDSCTWSGSGDWNIVDNCTLTANTDIGTNTLRLLCTGQINILAQIIFGHLEKSNNCIVVKDNTKALVKVG